MSKLTPEQEETKGLILFYFMNHWAPKYDVGAEKYGTNLKDMSIDELIDNAYQEVEDLVSYLTTILIKLDEQRKVEPESKSPHGNLPTPPEN